MCREICGPVANGVTREGCVSSIAWLGAWLRFERLNIVLSLAGKVWGLALERFVAALVVVLNLHVAARVKVWWVVQQRRYSGVFSSIARIALNLLFAATSLTGARRICVALW